MIYLRRRDRLSNWFCDFCFARGLAQRFGYRLATPPMPGFSATSKIIQGEDVYGPVVCWQGNWPFDGHSGRRLVREELFRAPGQRIRLDGLFQRFELIADVREEIRGDWLRLDGAMPTRAAGDFLICLRLGDGDGKSKKMANGIKGMDQADADLNEAEIRRLVRTVRHERLYLLTGALGDPLVAAVRDLGAEVVYLGGMAAFRFIHSFQKVAIGQSAFQWWAAFLGAAREIYFPKIDLGAWSHPEPAVLAHDPAHWGIDLRVMDEPRYIYDW